MSTSERSFPGAIAHLPKVYYFGPFRLDPSRRLFHRDDVLIPLAPRVFDVLLMLVASRDRLVTKDEFMDTIWGGEAVTEGSLSQHVFLARKALGEGANSHEYILTVQGKGYRFIHPVEARESLAQSISGEEAAAIRDLLVDQKFEAFRYYCEAQYQAELRTEASLIEAIRLFETALKIDPAYDPAQVGIAQAYSLLGEYLFMPPFEVFPKAKNAALRALQLNAMNSDAHAVLGQILVFCNRDWLGAEREFDIAVKLNPASVLVRHYRSWFLIWTGAQGRALAEIGQALRVNPSSLLLATTLGMVLIHNDEYAQAVSQLRAVINRDPNYRLADYYLALALILSANPNEAISLLSERAQGEYQPQNLALLGVAYASAGKSAKAKKIIGDLTNLASGRYVAKYLIAEIYAALGELDEAMLALEASFDASEAWLAFLKTDPLFKALASERRLKSLLERIVYSSRPSAPE